MDSESRLSKFTVRPAEVKRYITDKNISEKAARDLVARDLLLERERRRKERYKNLSLIDRLTGFFNQRGLLGDEASNPPIIGELQRLFDLAQRHGHSLSLLMVDFDWLKRYNGDFGHLAGNEALRDFAKIFKEEMRTSDVAARYGGDEFTFLLPETDLKGAIEFAERVREKLAKNSGVFKRPITTSIGVASFPDEKINSADELIVMADKALYLAKERGKNNVCSYKDVLGKRVPSPIT